MTDGVQASGAADPAPADAGARIEQLRDELHLRDALLLALAHDLRASIAAIAGVSTTLRERAGEASSHGLLDVIDEATAAVQIVISNIFDVERLRHDSLAVVRQATDLADLLARSVEVAGLTGKVAIEVEPGVADLDAGLTERILWNLLTNAAVHAPAGTPITLCASLEDGCVLIHVEDEGPGIPEPEREAVFEAFRQGATSGQGSGLGLYLVRQLARAQDGEAWISERPGGGTAVHVRLPC